MLPFHCTVECAVEPAVKFVPLMINVNAALPGGIEDGLRLVVVGAGGTIAKVTKEAVPTELVTATCAVPGAPIRPAGTKALISVALTYVVARAVPLHTAVESVVKFVPLMVNVKAAPPGVAEDGLRPVICGASDEIGQFNTTLAILREPRPVALL